MKSKKQQVEGEKRVIVVGHRRRGSRCWNGLRGIGLMHLHADGIFAPTGALLYQFRLGVTPALSTVIC